MKLVHTLGIFLQKPSPCQWMQLLVNCRTSCPKASSRYREDTYGVVKGDKHEWTVLLVQVIGDVDH